MAFFAMLLVGLLFKSEGIPLAVTAAKDVYSKTWSADEFKRNLSKLEEAKKPLRVKLRKRVVSFSIIDPNKGEEVLKLEPLIVVVGRAQFREGILDPLVLSPKELEERILTYQHTAKSLNARPEISILVDEDYNPELLMDLFELLNRMKFKRLVIIKPVNPHPAPPRPVGPRPLPRPPIPPAK